MSVKNKDEIIAGLSLRDQQEKEDCKCAINSKAKFSILSC